MRLGMRLGMRVVSGHNFDRCLQEGPWGVQTSKCSTLHQQSEVNPRVPPTPQTAAPSFLATAVAYQLDQLFLLTSSAPLLMGRQVATLKGEAARHP